MTPRHLRWLARGGESHRAAKTPAFNLVAHVDFLPAKHCAQGAKPWTSERDWNVADEQQAW
jgi:hypothetical protein